ncbi:hypothetical protein AB9K41_00095 [Cribrihabitans sp. XS_ASV171]
MDKKPAGTQAICLVLHPSPVIGTDLSDILVEGGLPRESVVIAAALDAVPSAFARLVIVDGGMLKKAGPTHLNDFQQQGTPLLVLDGGSMPDLPQSPFIRTVAQPFRTADVLHALREIGVI